MAVPAIAMGSDVTAEARPDPVIGGQPASTCEWPSTVHVPVAGSFCTGTLVHPELVLTAAHCVAVYTGYGASPLETTEIETINFGEVGDSPAATASVEYCKRHPQFPDPVTNPADRRYDHAYCKLATPVTDVPATPPAMGCEVEDVGVGTPVTVAGFGQNEGQLGSKYWADTTVSGAVSEFVPEIGGGGAGSCPGDSGGPSFLQVSDGSWRLYASVSGGPGCGAAIKHTLLSQAVPWIEEHSGVDISPCHDADGTWNPGPACHGFSKDPFEAVSWADGCPSSDTVGWGMTCGEPYSTDPPPDTDGDSGDSSGNGDGGTSGGSDTGPADSGTESGDPSAGSDDFGSGTDTDAEGPTQMDGGSDAEGCGCRTYGSREGPWWLLAMIPISRPGRLRK